MTLLQIILILTLITFLTGSYKFTGKLACGLVGFSGNQPFNLSIIRVLLHHNALTRGKHATGIFTRNGGITKDAIEADKFIVDAEKMKSVSPENLLMGHVRHATIGGNSDKAEAAHPWDFGDIVMMHNGTLTNYEQLASDYKLKKEDWMVDSQVLGLAIQDNFRNEKPFAVLSEYAGAAAVVVYHKKRDSLFVYRDTERTLFYGYLEDGQIYISSLDNILHVIGCKDIKPFEPFKVYEIKEGKILHKFQIKRKKAVKNTFFKNILSKASKIFKAINFTTTKFILDDNNVTGIAKSILKASYLEGYYLRCLVDVSDKSPLAKISKNNYYRPIKIVDDREFTITDNNKHINRAFTAMFDTDNFIPAKGNYVVYMGTDLKSRFKKEELYEVVSHTFGFPNLIIKDHLTNEVIVENIMNFRTASYEEMNEYFKSVSSSKDDGDADNKTEEKAPLLIELKGSDDLIGQSTIEDAEFEEVTTDETDDEVDEDELVLEKLLILLNILDEEVESITDDFEDSAKEDILKRLLKITTLLNKCNDYKDSFIFNINENSLKNLELA